MSLNKNSHLFVSPNTQYVLPSHCYPSCRPGDSINFSGTLFSTSDSTISTSSWTTWFTSASMLRRTRSYRQRFNCVSIACLASMFYSWRTNHGNSGINCRAGGFDCGYSGQIHAACDGIQIVGLILLFGTAKNNLTFWMNRLRKSEEIACRNKVELFVDQNLTVWQSR